MMRRLQVAESLIAGILHMFLVSQHVGSAQKVFGYALTHSRAYCKNRAFSIKVKVLC